MDDLNKRYVKQPDRSVEVPQNEFKRHVDNNPMDEIEQSPEILAKIKEYSDDPYGFLVLAGKNGTGKSFAAKKILYSQSGKEYFHDSDHRLFITQAQLNIRWQSQIKNWGDTLYLLKQMNAVRLLVLDDIGTRIPSEAFMDFLYAIIDFRCDCKESLPTIITTNLTSKQIRENFGDAFTSRICSGEVIKFEGVDRRINEW